MFPKVGIFKKKKKFLNTYLQNIIYIAVIFLVSSKKKNIIYIIKLIENLIYYLIN